jgi:hypothetical protein
MDHLELSHLPAQVLSSPSLPNPPQSPHPPHSNHPKDYACTSANQHLVRAMAPMDENERSAKRQKLASDESTGLNDEAFFQARPDGTSTFNV